MRFSSFHSLSTRLILGIVAAILATTIAAGLPAYWFVRSELESQAWARVKNGARITQALISAEQNRLSDLAAHSAQRPTLLHLLDNGDMAGLVDYLQNFQKGVGLDILLVSDTKGRILNEGALSNLQLEPPYSSEVAFYTLPGFPPRLALITSQPVLGPEIGTYYVTVGKWLDDDFVEQLATQSGFEQSILIHGKRSVSSIANPTGGVNQVVIEQSAVSGIAETVSQAIGGAQYYSALQPLIDAQGNAVAYSEVSLPVGDLVTATRRSLQVLIFSTLMIALIVSILGALFARRLTAPLRTLTEAALNISRGDLVTPVPVPAKPTEIATLASAYEQSRINMHRYLDDLSQAKVWSDNLIQSVVEGIVTIDEGGGITSFSQGAERITGWEIRSAVGQSIDRIFTLYGDQGSFTDHIPPFGGKHQISILSYSGQPITIAVTSAKLKSPTSGSVQTVLVLRDITEEEAAQRLRTYFLANISHEFRTPLSAINASVELLLEELENFSLTEIGELIHSIYYSLTGLQTLIDNLLESTNIEAGHFRIKRRPTDFNEVVSEAVRVMEPLLERRRQRLVRNEPLDSPQVNVDPTRLTQVVVNLLSNASKYSPIEGTIELTAEKIQGEMLSVKVADRGPGIAPSEQKYLFHRFVRLGDQNEAQYGIGLGLSVVKTIIEEHSGKVGVDERPGGGSVFWFVIPLNGDVK